MRNVVVIGGGVVGCLSAYHLVKAGWSVTVVERGRVGGGCSHGNCGYVCPSHVLPLAVPGAIGNTLKTLFARNSPLKVRPGFALTHLGWFLRFAKRCNTKDMLTAAVGIQALLNSSRKLFDELLETERLDVEWDTSGLLFVFQSKAAFDHYAETDHLLRDRFAMPAERFDADALLKMEPSLKPGSVSGGYLYRSDAQLRPDRLMAALHQRLREYGVRFVENAEMTRFAPANGKAQAVVTTVGEFPAEAFVVATGAWAPKLNEQLGMSLPIIPGKGYSITIPRPSICPTYPMIFEEHRVAVSPFRTGFRIGSTMEFAGYNESMNRNRLKLLTDAAAVYLTDPGNVTSAAEEWWGWRPMTPSGLPVIDRSPLLGNVLVAAGHGMLGLSMATGTGKLVAELLAGEKTHIPAEPYRL
ncbi:MAG: FAD-dependent oxidoreductase [Fimbriiglobus sp.]|nr:FAD-dependent oxidoreductase [Fimbriiglobus sp.]